MHQKIMYISQVFTCLSKATMTKSEKEAASDGAIAGCQLETKTYTSGRGCIYTSRSDMSRFP